jgi:V-type H+-transporting ATPase subunit D
MSSTRVNANRSQLQMWKAKLVGASKGHSLLKRKLEGLKKEFSAIMEKLIRHKKTIGKLMKNSVFLLTEAQWGAGDFGKTLADTVKRSSTQVEMILKQKGGIYLPKFKSKQEQIEDPTRSLGITGGGLAIQKSKKKFEKLLMRLVKIAGLQVSYHTLDEVIRITSRRVNALENVVIPRFQGYIQYIIRELDEMEREDFFMLKKVVENKKKLIEKNRQQKADETLQAEKDNGGALESKDEDLIF